MQKTGGFFRRSLVLPRTKAVRHMAHRLKISDKIFFLRERPRSFCAV